MVVSIAERAGAAEFAGARWAATGGAWAREAAAATAKKKERRDGGGCIIGSARERGTKWRARRSCATCAVGASNFLPANRAESPCVSASARQCVRASVGPGDAPPRHCALARPRVRATTRTWDAHVGCAHGTRIGRRYGPARPMRARCSNPHAPIVYFTCAFHECDVGSLARAGPVRDAHARAVRRTCRLQRERRHPRPRHSAADRARALCAVAHRGWACRDSGWARVVSCQR